MHRLFIALFALVSVSIVVCAPAAADVPLINGAINNGSFETGDLTDWTAGNHNAVVGQPVNVQDGSFAASIDGGPCAVSVLFQTFPADPGNEFYMSGYMLSETALGSSFALLKSTFRDSAGNDLTPASISIGVGNPNFPGAEAVPFLDSSSFPNTWIFTELQAVAPADAVEVQFFTINVDINGCPDGFDPGSVNPIWFDNIQAAEILPDADGDGFSPPVDCNDNDAAINPSAIEITGNYVDENCDGDLGACPPCLEWKNHGQFVRCIANEAQFLPDDLADGLVSSAAKTDIGKKGFVPAECQ